MTKDGLIWFNNINVYYTSLKNQSIYGKIDINMTVNCVVDLLNFFFVIKSVKVYY
jgi:hypothetical protein